MKGDLPFRRKYRQHPLDIPRLTLQDLYRITIGIYKGIYKGTR